MRRHACRFVKKCLLNNRVNETFHQYFKVTDHLVNTRNNNKLVKLPVINLETARNGLIIYGCKIVQLTSHYNTINRNTRCNLRKASKDLVSPYKKLFSLVTALNCFIFIFTSRPNYTLTFQQITSAWLNELSLFNFMNLYLFNKHYFRITLTWCLATLKDTALR